MSIAKAILSVLKSIFSCALLSVTMHYSITEVNAADNESICDRRAKDEGIPYSNTITLTANDGSSVLVKQTCPLRQSYLVVSVFDQKSNSLLQEFRIDEEDYRFFSPDTKDVNLDGYPDLMFVVSGGAANICYSIWLFDPTLRRFHNILGGNSDEDEACFANFYMDRNGYYVTNAKAGGGSWDFSFYTLTNWKLKPKFAISLKVSSDLDDKQNYKTSCRMRTLPSTGKQKTKPVRDKYLRETYCNYYDQKDSNKRSDH